MVARLRASHCAISYEGKPDAGTRPVLKIFRCPKRYGCGAVLLSQVVIAAMLKRTTASSYEQK
jgi:hypothetical protein